MCDFLPAECMSGPRGGPMLPRPPLLEPWRCAAPQLHAFTTYLIISGDLSFKHSQRLIPVQALPPAGSCHQPSQNFNVRFAHASMSKVRKVVSVLERQHSRVFSAMHSACLASAGCFRLTGEGRNQQHCVDTGGAALHHRVSEGGVHHLGRHQLHVRHSAAGVLLPPHSRGTES